MTMCVGYMRNIFLNSASSFFSVVVAGFFGELHFFCDGYGLRINSISVIEIRAWNFLSRFVYVGSGNRSLFFIS